MNFVNIYAFIENMAEVYKLICSCSFAYNSDFNTNTINFKFIKK